MKSASSQLTLIFLSSHNRGIMARKPKRLKEDGYINPNDVVGKTVEEQAPSEVDEDKALNPEDIPEEEGLPLERVDLGDIEEDLPKKKGPKSKLAAKTNGEDVEKIISRKDLVRVCEIYKLSRNSFLDNITIADMAVDFTLHLKMDDRYRLLNLVGLHEDIRKARVVITRYKSDLRENQGTRADGVDTFSELAFDQLESSGLTRQSIEYLDRKSEIRVKPMARCQLARIYTNNWQLPPIVLGYRGLFSAVVNDVNNDVSAYEARKKR